MGSLRKFTAENWMSCVTGAVLIGFLTSLMVINYRTQTKLQEASLTHMIHDLEKHASTAKYYFAERRQDLLTLSQAWELTTYFAKNTIGISGENELKNVLVQIKNRFDLLIQNRKLAGKNVFRCIALHDINGKKLISSGKNHPFSFTGSVKEQGVRFRTMFQRQKLSIIAESPYFYRGVFKGFLVACINIETTSIDAIHAGHTPEDHPIFINFGGPGGMSAYPIQPPEMVKKMIGVAELTPTRFTISISKEKNIEYTGIKTTIEGTPFTMNQAIPVQEFGYDSPSFLLLAMAILAVLAAGVAYILWRMSARELVLKTHLAEEKILKEEIAARNKQLETVIKIRSQLEQTLKESEEKFRKICTAAKDAILMLDNEGKVCFWNHSAAQIFNLSEKEALNSDFCAGMAPEEDLGWFKKEYLSFSQTGMGESMGTTIEITAQRNDGQRFPAEVSFSGMKLAQKWHLIVILRDVTQRKQAETELENHRKNLEKLVLDRTSELEKAQKILVNKALEAGRVQLSSMMLHNIGNAITPVSLTASKLKSKYDGKLETYLEKCYQDMYEFKDDLSLYIKKNPRGIQVFELMGELIAELAIDNHKSEELLDKILAGIEYIATILTANRAYAPTMKETIERVNLNSLVEDAIKIQEGSFNKRHIKLNKILTQDLPYYLTEKNKLMQVVINLMKNACDAIDSHIEKTDHQIDIRTYQEHDNIIFEISDTGIGIKKDRLEEIFKYGISSKGSSGFGLYYTKNFIESCHGTLSIKSDGHGKGATFTLNFPLPLKNEVIKNESSV